MSRRLAPGVVFEKSLALLCTVIGAPLAHGFLYLNLKNFGTALMDPNKAST